jgi:uncharacterized phage protein (TIGR02220 family)
MSMLLMVKAMQTKVGNPLRKLVLIKLADNANDLGECWPSYQHIADQCEISRRSVINHVKALESAGMLVKQYRTGTHKPNASNIYTLHLDGESPAPSPSAAPAPRTSHSIEPVNEPKAIVELKPDIAEKVIQYLNDKTGKSFRVVKTHTDKINARIKEGATLTDLINVIDRKSAEWLTDDNMSQYLRPATLFSAEKFNNYLGQVGAPLPNAKKPDFMDRHTGFTDRDYGKDLNQNEDGSYEF